MLRGLYIANTPVLNIFKNQHGLFCVNAHDNCLYYGGVCVDIGTCLRLGLNLLILTACVRLKRLLSKEIIRVQSTRKEYGLS